MTTKKPRRFTAISVPEELYQTLKKLSKQERRTISALIRILLQDALELKQWKR